jgi:hypothetical protein
MLAVHISALEEFDLLFPEQHQNAQDLHVAILVEGGKKNIGLGKCNGFFAAFLGAESLRSLIDAFRALNLQHHGTFHPSAVVEYL